MSIGDKIRDIRTKRGDSLRSLGIKINYSHGTLGKVERGEIKPSIELLEKIAETYDVPMTHFIVPDELQKMGVEWIGFVEEMQEKELTPDEIRAAIEIIEKLRKLDGKDGK